MSDRAFIRFGHGYETGSRGRCEAFDGFDIIAAPLHQEGDGWQAAFGNKARESRSFPRKDGRPGVTYSSHAIKLAKFTGESGWSAGLYILMHHGGGREVLAVPSFYDGGDLEAAILAMPERLQYALLYTIWNTASNARHQAQAETARIWETAFKEKRIRQRRATSQRAARVEIVSA
ncbi:hypothetical protein [Mesorhizobium sp.]|uniref:hypothetical protein n=1 Tax=Mesorhizobium sp. TaxID=1871066 RepID=UPI0011FBFEC9|nr:hypothetical protein [Mesorhizobium sp.]TIX28858.1 MAG: hypothetical protein E5V35_00420 [Mesorhizobium sp.]